MASEGFSAHHRVIGISATWAVSFLLVAYAITMSLGFLSLKSPLDPIGDPYFTIMELLIILIAPLMVLSMIAVYGYASPDVRVYGLIALVFMILLAAITSCVHFVVLTVSHQIEAGGFADAPLFFSFNWPSVGYTLDILAWDWFFALSMLFAAPVFRGGRMERSLQVLMIISGVLSLAGLIGVALADMQIRDIGIVGYALVSIIVFLLLGIVFRSTPCAGEDSAEGHDS